MSLEALVKLAVWNYVLYSSFNHLRCLVPEMRRLVDVQGVLEQYYREVSKDSPEAMFIDQDE